MRVNKSTLRIVVYSCLVATCRWHRMTAHPPIGRPYSGMMNGAGLKVKNNFKNNDCAIHDTVGASGTLSLTESFLYVRAQASHCSCLPYLIHRLPEKKKMMSPDSTTCSRRLRAKDLCTACISGVLYPCVSSSSIIPEWSVIARILDPRRATDLASVAES